MGDVVRLNPPRTVALIVSEILLDEGRLGILRRQCQGRTPTQSEDEAWSLLEDRIFKNRIEAKALIERQCGVDWESIEGALF